MSKNAWVSHGGERGKGKREVITTLDDLVKLMKAGEDEITICTFVEFLNKYYLKTKGEKPVDLEIIIS